ncbi:MAG: preprotein translocase subunit YajC [Firmicutes bacterium ML8_F2]|nr:MAG: preprotein translocase subunit YajC [Firmicutes bacterium ML8_F2]
MESLGPFIPLILLFVLFYFLLIRPQQKQQKKRQEMLKSLNKGDRVITIGGIHGVIKEIDDTTISLRVADNLNLKFARASVDRVIEEENE